MLLCAVVLCPVPDAGAKTRPDREARPVVETANSYVARRFLEAVPKWAPALQTDPDTGKPEPGRTRFCMPVDSGPAYQKAHRKFRKRASTKR